MMIEHCKSAGMVIAEPRLSIASSTAHAFGLLRGKRNRNNISQHQSSFTSPVSFLSINLSSSSSYLDLGLITYLGRPGPHHFLASSSAATRRSKLLTCFTHACISEIQMCNRKMKECKVQLGPCMIEGVHKSKHGPDTAWL